MHMFFSALVTRTSQQPTQTPTRQTTLDACMQNFEFQHYITWGVGRGRLQGILQKLALFYESTKKLQIITNNSASLQQVLSRIVELKENQIFLSSAADTLNVLCMCPHCSRHCFIFQKFNPFVSPFLHIGIFKTVCFRILITGRETENAVECLDLHRADSLF